MEFTILGNSIQLFNSMNYFGFYNIWSFKSLMQIAINLKNFVLLCVFHLSMKCLSPYLAINGWHSQHPFWWKLPKPFWILDNKKIEEISMEMFSLTLSVSRYYWKGVIKTQSFVIKLTEWNGSTSSAVFICICESIIYFVYHKNFLLFYICYMSNQSFFLLLFKYDKRLLIICVCRDEASLWTPLQPSPFKPFNRARICVS